MAIYTDRIASWGIVRAPDKFFVRQTVEAKMRDITEIRELIEKEKDIIEARNRLAAFIKAAPISTIEAAKEEVTRWLVGDLAGSEFNASIWILKQDCVAERLRTANLLQEITEILLAKFIKRGDIPQVSFLRKLVDRTLTITEVEVALTEYIDCHQGNFEAEEICMMLRLLPETIRTQIVRKFLAKTISKADWYQICLLAEKVSGLQRCWRGLEKDTVNKTMQTCFPDLFSQLDEQR